MSRILAAVLSAVCLAALATAVEPSNAGAAPAPNQTMKRGGDSLCC